MSVNYQYQTTCSQSVFEKLINPTYEAAILAACPSSGKTTISHLIINRYLQQYPNANVVVLTHGQNILKNQYLQSLQKPNIQINFTFGCFGSGKQVQVGIPHSIKKYTEPKIDLLVVDECHEFYLQQMVQDIISLYTPKHQLLLTGSPSEFNRLNKNGKKYGITYIPGSELFKYNVFSSVVLDVVPVKFRNNTIDSFKTMYEHAQKQQYNLSKIMVAVRNINEAQNVSYILKKIGRNVGISTSKHDRNNTIIEDFKNNIFDTLVVVQKGILGFSDNYITALFDLRCSEDVDISNQLFARVLRKHPDGIKKIYLRCGEKGSKDFNNQVIMLYKIEAMMRNDIFINYDKTNMVVNY